MLDSLRICNGVTLYKKDTCSVKTIAFATDQNNSNIHNFYINNIDTLKRIRDQFLLQYKEELSNRNLLNLIKIPDIIKCSDMNVQSNLHSKNIFTNYLKINGNTFVISEKMMEIIKCLAHGMSAKDIASKINNSNRTVEKCIEQFKEKANIYSRSEIINAYWRKNDNGYSF